MTDYLLALLVLLLGVALGGAGTWAWVRRGGRTAAPPPRPCSCWACFDPFHDRQPH